jgi:hypothetical protein
MSPRENVLFCEGEVDATLRAHFDQVQTKVDAIPKDQFLATPEDDLVEHIHSSMLVQPLTIYEDRMVMEQHESKVDVSHHPTRGLGGDRGPIMIPSVKVVVSIPYAGEEILWRLRPNHWSSVFPHASVRKPDRNGIGYVDITIEQPFDDPPEI